MLLGQCLSDLAFWMLLSVLAIISQSAYHSPVNVLPVQHEILGQGGDLLRFAGQEFGTNTGRPRRCGWLDIVALKYSCQINGFSSLNLTKLDVLSDLPEIQLGVSYKHINGTPIKSFPADLRLLEQLKASSFNPSPLFEF
ncbi:adenylosuccinate synthetase 2, chloroplastic [Fagus crenata]